MGDLPAYTSPIDGRLVDGRAQRREDLKRPAAGRMTKANAPKHAPAPCRRGCAALDAQRECDGRQVVRHESSSRSHELLEQAIRSGADVQLKGGNG
jgi:hypothetical protein